MQIRFALVTLLIIIVFSDNVQNAALPDSSSSATGYWLVITSSFSDGDEEPKVVIDYGVLESSSFWDEDRSNEQKPVVATPFSALIAPAICPPGTIPDVDSICRDVY